MDTDDLLELAGDPRFISGIYNYCDRWCERCGFTSRCLVYATEQNDSDGLGSHDVNNQKFWLGLQAILGRTREMISRWADENGVSLDELQLSAEDQQKAEARLAAAAENELVRAAGDYLAMTRRWFEKHEARVNTAVRASSAASATASTTPGGAAEFEERVDLNDAVEVINWYVFFIAAKIRRAVTREGEPDAEHDGEHDETDGEAGGWQKDSDGSVKIALIGIDRSLGAWGKLHGYLGEVVEILPIMLHLERLRRDAEREFPNARRFIRPGFDESPDLLVS